MIGNSMNDQNAKINGLIDRIEAHQKSLKATDAEFVGKYPQFLGSAKTWRDRLCKRQFADFGKNLPRWERKLENFVAEIDGRSFVEVYFEQMPFSQRMDGMMATLVAQRTDRRCGVCLSPTGVGKSVWARHTLQGDPRGVAYIRVNESWRDSRMQIAAGMAKGLRCPANEQPSAASSLNQVIEALRNNPLTVILDEAHEGGILLMKLVKTLIDETSARFVLLAFPTTWRRMMSASDDARAEATQLFGRTLKPVFDDYSEGLRQNDVAMYLRLSTGLGDEVDQLAKDILPLVRANGNLRLLADAVEGAQRQADVTEEPVDSDLIRAHVTALCPVKKGGAK
jgi:hypothetical protein